MGFIKVEQENSTPIEIYYEDHGLGFAGRAHPWLAVKRRRLGKTDRRAAGRRPSRDHVLASVNSANARVIAPAGWASSSRIE